MNHNNNILQKELLFVSETLFRDISIELSVMHGYIRIEKKITINM